jgi:hypothetical protein
METKMSQQKVIIRFDTNSDPEKWHVDVQRKNTEGEYEPSLDSDRADFPIDVEIFGAFEEDLLIQSLKNTFPGAEISLKF